MNPISIIIADDHQLFIDGLSAMFIKEVNIVVEDVANSGKELIDIVEVKKPDLVLLDINMAGMNGLEALRRIRQLGHDTKVLILSTYCEDHLIAKAKSYGANGYMLKTSSKNELINGIKEVMEGHQYFPLEFVSKAIRVKDQFSIQFNLTKRENEIMHLIGQGITSQRIAEQLFLSQYTVETHRKNIMQKLGLKTAAGLLKFIFENKV